MEVLKISHGLLKYINKRFTIKKNNSYSINGIDSPPIISNINKKNINIEKKEISYFYSIITNHIRYYNFPYMHENLKTLKLYPNYIKEPKFIKKRVKGYYNFMNNTIRYQEILGESVLPHELFHMSSTVKNKKDFSIFSGFSQSSISGNYKLIGLGLNEGYTQLLTERYFNVEKKGYPLETLIASKIEDIIGKDKMQIMYFNADLKKLINELLKYSDEESIIKFIYNIDCFKTLYSKFITEKDFLNIKRSYYYVIEFLLNLKFEKLIDDEISFNEIEDQLINYVKEFKNKAFVNNGYVRELIEEEDYNILVKKQLEKFMNLYISKKDYTAKHI